MLNQDTNADTIETDTDFDFDPADTVADAVAEALNTKRSRTRQVYQIWLTGVRKELLPQVEPYYYRLGTGRFIGFRKEDSKRGTWVAKMRLRRTKNHGKTLGDVGRMSYDEARKLAEEWFASLQHADGGMDSATTVRDALEALIANRRDNKGEQYAHKLERHVRRIWEQDAEFCALRCGELTQRRIEKWRAGLVYLRGKHQGKPLGKSTQNRLMDYLRTALNLIGKRSPALRAEVRDVKSHKASNPRAIVLTPEERQRLIDAAGPDLRDLIEGTLRMGSRPGDLPRMRRCDYDAKEQLVHLTTKGAKRWVPLPLDAQPLFARLAEGRAENEFLFRRADGSAWGDREAASSWCKQIKTVVKAAGLPSSVCLYTLRHTFITQAINDGLNPSRIAKLCGTSLRQIEKTYYKLLHKEGRETMQAVNVLSAPATTGNVIQFPGAAQGVAPAAIALARAVADLPRDQLLKALARLPVQQLSNLLSAAEAAA